MHMLIYGVFSWALGLVAKVHAWKITERTIVVVNMEIRQRAASLGHLRLLKHANLDNHRQDHSRDELRQ